MGFGHAIYAESDPRNAVIKEWSEKLGKANGNTSLYDISVRCEAVMWREKNCSVTPISSTLRLTTTWVFQPSCLRLFLSVHV